MTDFANTSHATLEALAAALAQAVQERRDLQLQLRARLLEAAAAILPELRAASARERDHQDALYSVVSAEPALFQRPRTRTVHGIKYGWVLGKSSIQIPDEDKTLKLIRAKVPAEQAALIIRVKESVDRHAVLDLSAQDLRRLGIVQVPGQDSPFVSLPKDAVDRLVDTLISETRQEAA